MYMANNDNHYMAMYITNNTCTSIMKFFESQGLTNKSKMFTNSNSPNFDYTKNLNIYFNYTIIQLFNYTK